MGEISPKLLAFVDALLNVRCIDILKEGWQQANWEDELDLFFILHSSLCFFIFYF